MRILLVAHLYLPEHAAGGEMYCHNIAKYMISRGHQFRVLLMDAAHYEIEKIYSYEGVEVFPAPRQGDTTVLFGWAEIVLTHLQYAAWAFYISNILKKPAVFVSHNTWPYDVVKQFPNQAVIYNSHAMKGILKYENPSFVLHPPVDLAKYDFGGPTGDCVTLVNMNANKGGKLFNSIARALPDRKFLAVTGGYDTQYGEKAHNLEIVSNNPDMRPVYERTRILLMPSKYESWGMCATEAMCNGIPVIYHPTFGLKENVGEYGMAIPDQNPGFQDDEVIKGGEHDGLDPEKNLAVWVAAIKKLDNPKAYKKYSNLARKRSLQLCNIAELQELESFLDGHISGSRELYANRAGITGGS